MSLTFDALQEMSRERCEHDYAQKVDSWSLNDWLVALAGEVGEAANLAKKVRRGDFALATVRDDIAEEIADCIIYCDLIMSKLGYPTGAKVREKFNAVSDRIASPRRL